MQRDPGAVPEVRQLGSREPQCGQPRVGSSVIERFEDFAGAVAKRRERRLVSRREDIHEMRAFLRHDDSMRPFLSCVICSIGPPSSPDAG